MSISHGSSASGCLILHVENFIYNVYAQALLKWLDIR
jgi:hypothetical protein